VRMLRLAIVYELKGDFFEAVVVSQITKKPNWGPDTRKSSCPRCTLIHDRWQEKIMPVAGTVRCIMAAAWHEVVVATRACACTRGPYKKGAYLFMVPIVSGHDSGNRSECGVGGDIDAACCENLKPQEWL
jgi:hypothetical protein